LNIRCCFFQLTFKVQEVKTGKDQIKSFKIATNQWSTQSLFPDPAPSQSVRDGDRVINDIYRAVQLDLKKPKAIAVVKANTGPVDPRQRADQAGIGTI
jgi:hypothetical protein